MLRVLGGVSIDEGSAVRSAAQRIILSALALDVGNLVSTDRLTELVWGEAPPDHPAAALQSQVSRLRRLLPDGIIIEPGGSGYRLVAGVDEIDASALDETWAVALAATGGRRLDSIDAALALWGGEPYAELADDDRAAAERARLESVRWSLRDLRAESLRADGRLHEAIGELEVQCIEAPLRERSAESLMRTYVEAGRRNDALAEYQRLRRDMVDELGLDPGPELRDLEAAILAEDVVAASTPSGHPAGRSRDVEIPASRFVGRAGDLARVGAAVDEDRIVTLVGPGGVGKTRLALHAAAAARERFDDGATLVELTEIRDPDQLGELMVSSLDVPARHGATNEELVVEALGRRSRLVVFDNCEHVIDGAAAFAETVVRRAPGLTILATSREPLNIDGEHVIRLRPLDASTDAVELFIDRARGHGHHDLDERCRPLVEQICVALDGLPLAVELAAARLASMSLEEMIDGLDERMALFSKGRRTAPERHRSLRGLVDWSVRSLEAELREILATVSVFSAPFTAEAAAAVTDRSPASARDAIDQLVDRSLLVEHRRVGRPTRYGFLETIRAYASEMLSESGRGDDVAEQHVTWVLGQAEALRRLMPDRPDAAAADDLMIELADVRLAHRRFVDADDVDRALRLCAALHFIALFRMHAEMFGWIREAADRFGEVDHPQAEDVLGSASIGMWVRGDLDAAREYAERAERRAAASRYPGAGRAAAEALADVHSFRGDNATSLECFERATELARVQGDRARIASNLADAALSAGYLGKADRARTGIARAWELVGPHGSDLLRAWVAYTEGESLAESDPEQAIVALEQATEVAGTCSLHFVTGVAGLTLTSLQVRRDMLDAAAPRLVDLLEHWRRAGAWVQHEITLRTVAELLVRAGRHDEAAVIVGFVLSNPGAVESTGPDLERLETARAAVLDVCHGADELMGEGAVLTREEVSDFALQVLHELAAAALSAHGRG